MKNTNLEFSDQSTSHATEPQSDLPLVKEAWSRESFPTSRLTDNTNTISNRESSQFLDMGSSELLYAKSAAEPVSADLEADWEAPDGKLDLPEIFKPEKTRTLVDIKLSGTEASTTIDNAPLKEIINSTGEQKGIQPEGLEELSKSLSDTLAKFHDDEINAGRKKLHDWADKVMQEPERSKFKDDMQTFEERAKQDGLPKIDVLLSYREIERLINATGETPLTALERERIAQQVMHQAAVPTSINQGYHNTCNVAAVEVRTYSRTPAAAARLVVDIALDGEYCASDGTIVKLNPQGHGESLQPTSDVSRTHASEIFQVTAVNLLHTKLNEKHGSNIRYEQREPAAGDKADTGEVLIDYSVPGGRAIRRSPYLDDGHLRIISNAISGRSEDDVVLVSDKYRAGDEDVSMIKTKEELAAKLKYLKENKQFPTILRVNTVAEPFYTDSGQGSAGGSGGPHVVTITDYDEKTGLVTVDNEWGKDADHGKDKPIHIHDLYTAMQSKQGIEDQLKLDVKWNREHNTIDPAKEMQLLRFRKLNGHITNSEYVKELNTVIENTHKSRQKGDVSEAQKNIDSRQLENLIRNGIPIVDQIMLFRKVHKLGLSHSADYKTQLAHAGAKSEKDFNGSSKQSPPWYDFSSPDPVRKHNREVAGLNAALSDLPPQDQKVVRELIQLMSR